MNDDAVVTPMLDEHQAREVRRAKVGIIAIAVVAIGGIVLMCLATAIVVLLRFWG